LNDLKKVKRMHGIPTRNYRNGERPTPILKISIEGQKSDLVKP
jgi:hypothetical protein